MPSYNPDKWIKQLRQCRHLPAADVKALCDMVRNILLKESDIQSVSSPAITICRSDIHGQFCDFSELLWKGGEMVPETSYIFMARMLSLALRIVLKGLI